MHGQRPWPAGAGSPPGPGPAPTHGAAADPPDDGVPPAQGTGPSASPGAPRPRVPLAQALAGIDGLLDAALAGLDDAPADPAAVQALGDAAVAAGRLAARLAALDATLLGRFEAIEGWRGHAGSLRGWLRQHTHGATGSCDARVALARQCDRHPLLAARLAEGLVEPAHLAVLAAAHRAARHLRCELDAAEPVIADYAAGVCPEDLRLFLHRLILTLDPDAADRKAERDLRQRAHLDLHPLADGWLAVSATLPPELGARLLGVLTALRRALARSTASPDAQVTETRTPGPSSAAGSDSGADSGSGSGAQAGSATDTGSGTDDDADTEGSAGPESDGSLQPVWLRNLDALAALLDYAEAGRRDGRPLPRLRGSRPVVTVTIQLADFLAARGLLAPGSEGHGPGSGGGPDAGDGPGACTRGQPFRPGPAALTGPASRQPLLITPEAARRLACDAVVRRLLLDPQGRPLDLGRATRTVTPAQDTAIRHRDRHRCRWPGCREPIDEIHHLHHWAAGGPTDTANLPGFCGQHHVLAQTTGSYAGYRSLPGVGNPTAAPVGGRRRHRKPRSRVRQRV